MDPNASDSSPQKTSPHSDPAALLQISTELTAQDSQLTLHQQQLTRAFYVDEELVRIQLIIPRSRLSAGPNPQ